MIQLPSLSGFLQQPVPKINIELPSIKMKNIITKYPSKPQIINCLGAGSGGGGAGQDLWQSTHEQAGLSPCQKRHKKCYIMKVKSENFLFYETYIWLITWYNSCI